MDRTSGLAAESAVCVLASELLARCCINEKRLALGYLHRLIHAGSDYRLEAFQDGVAVFFPGGLLSSDDRPKFLALSLLNRSQFCQLL